MSDLVLAAGVGVATGGVIGILACAFGFHCGFIYGRYGISAYEYHKRRALAELERRKV